MGLGTQGRVPGPCAAPQAPLSQLLWDGDSSGGLTPASLGFLGPTVSPKAGGGGRGRRRWEGLAEMGGAGGGRRPRWAGPADGACGGPYMCVQNW